MYLAQISSAEENDSSPQQKIGNSSKYSKIQSNPVLHLHSRAPSLGDTYFRRKQYSFFGLYYTKIIGKTNGQEDSAFKFFLSVESKIREARWCKNDHDLFCTQILLNITSYDVILFQRLETVALLIVYVLLFFSGMFSTQGNSKHKDRENNTISLHPSKRRTHGKKSPFQRCTIL